jgi:hypothetical protein
MDWIFWEPSRMKFRSWPFREVKTEELRELLYTEWAGSDSNTLEKTVGKFPIYFVDIF